MDTLTVDPLASISSHYATQIRAEIEREVKGLIAKVKVRGNLDYRPTEAITPQCVWLGYIINSCRGKALYEEGELIEGIPVRWDRSEQRSITVDAGKVEFCWEDETRDEDGDWVTKKRYDTVEVIESVTW